MRFRSETVESIGKLIASLDSERDSLQTRLTAADASLGELALAAHQGDPSAVTKLEASRRDEASIRRQLTEIGSARRVAELKYGNLLFELKSQEKKAKWAEIDKLGQEREKLALELDGDVIEMARKFNRVLELGVTMFSEAPTQAASSLTSADPIKPVLVAGRFKQYLQKSGLESLFGRPAWGYDDIPLFSEIVRGGNQWVLKARKTDLGSSV